MKRSDSSRGIKKDIGTGEGKEEGGRRKGGRKGVGGRRGVPLRSVQIPFMIHPLLARLDQHNTSTASPPILS